MVLTSACFKNGTYGIKKGSGVFLHKVQQLVHSGERNAGDGVGTAVIDGDASRGAVRQGGAGEDHVGHVAHAFVKLPRRHQVVLGAVFHLPRLVQIQ